MAVPRIGIVGIGGFGWSHVDHLAELHKRRKLKLTAAADPAYEQLIPTVDRLKSLGAQVFDSLENLLDSGLVDAVTCATPIPRHAPMALQFAAEKIPFYMEKPPAVTIQDMDRVIETVDEAKVPAAAGFQLLSMPSVQAVKKQIVSGRFGAVKEVVATGIWKRLNSYYERTSWAGQLMENGDYVLDGTLFNPLAHILHLGLYFASAQRNQAAKPVNVRAELYHVHKIASEDTACVEAELDSGARLLFFATLCAPKQLTPEIIIDMERGSIRWRPGTEVTIVENGEEKTETFPTPEERIHLLAFSSFVNAIARDAETDCPLALCRSFVQTGNGAFLSSGLPHDISERHIRRTFEQRSQTAELIGIREAIRRAVRERKLFADLEIPWSVPGEWVDVSDLQEFRLFEE
ncbi:MAG: Gfo/Idh/MocA family oxidoreductase [bacterium]